MKIEQKGLDKIKKIYNLFADNKSKYIFKNRLMFNLFDENEYIRNIIKTNRVAADFLDKLLNENDPVVVWGVGIRAHKFRLFYPEVEVMCYIDSNKHGETYNGIEIISFEEYLNRGLNTKIVILPRFSHKEIEHEIKQAGIKEHNILNFAKIMDYLYEVQYFDLPQIKEVKYFIDGGAYDGADTLKFAKNFRGGVSQIWEPNKCMIEHITKKLENQQVAYEIINAGMSNEESFALSYDKKDEQSAFSLQAALNGNIKLDYIDNHMKEKVSMIKMDIEGFEYRALVGAKQTISLFQPYLAICVYHKQEDIWKIPELIYSICPRYKFYLRHYSLFPNETVLYAIIS